MEKEKAVWSLVVYDGPNVTQSKIENEIKSAERARTGWINKGLEWEKRGSS
jgi:hypothetical protein